MKRETAWKIESVAIEKPWGIFRTTIASNEQLMLCHFLLTKGVHTSFHGHPAAQNGYPISGTLRMLRESGQEFTAEPGSGCASIQTFDVARRRSRIVRLLNASHRHDRTMSLTEWTEAGARDGVTRLFLKEIPEPMSTAKKTLRSRAECQQKETTGQCCHEKQGADRRRLNTGVP